MKFYYSYYFKHTILIITFILLILYAMQSMLENKSIPKLLQQFRRRLHLHRRLHLRFHPRFRL